MSRQENTSSVGWNWSMVASSTRLTSSTGQCGQVEDALGHRRKALVQVVRQIDGTDRKNGIAGEPHQQHPFLLWCHARRCRGSGTLTTANPGGSTFLYGFYVKARTRSAIFLYTRAQAGLPALP